MAFNGSGVFVRLYNWVNDKAALIKVRADRMDAEMDGFATGLSNCITKDGQTTVTANLPMAGFRHTGVGNSSDRAHYAATGQVQDGKLNWVVAGGTVDALTATYSPAITALVDGQECNVRTTGTNATTTPTFAPNGLTARTIVKNGGSALIVGDIPYEAKLRYNLANTRWELQNPLSAPVANGGTGQSSYTIGDLLYASGTSALSKLAAVALNKKLYSGGVGTAPFWGDGFKIITISRDTTTATGSVAYTGVGFKPSAFIAFGGVNGTSKIQLFGMTDGTTSQAIADNSAVSAGTYDMTGLPFYIPNTSGNFTTGALASFDTDGFTISWTKTGSPTGTATLYVLCMR